MPTQAYQLFSKGWFAGKNLCVFIGAFHNFIKNAEWMSIAVIAVMKCTCLVKPRIGNRIFSGITGKLILALIWIYAALVAIILHFKVCDIK